MNKVVHYKFPLIAKSRQELLLISWICSSFNLVDYLCPAWLIIFLLLWIYLYAVCESTRYKWTSWKKEMKVTYTIVVRLIPDIWESIFFFCSTSLMILTHFGRGTAAENSKEQNQNQGRAGENCTWWVLCCYIIIATNQTVTVSHFYTGFISMVTPAYELAIINATTWTVTPCLGSNIKPL